MFFCMYFILLHVKLQLKQNARVVVVSVCHVIGYSATEPRPLSCR